MSNMNGREYPKDFEWDAWEHLYDDADLNKEPKVKKMKKEKDFSSPKKRSKRNR